MNKLHNFHSLSNMSFTILPLYRQQDNTDDEYESKHQGSADSGQSSSTPDLGDSSSDSIADSLEDHGKVHGTASPPDSSAIKQNSGDLQDTEAEVTVRSLQESALNKIAQKSMSEEQAEVAAPAQQEQIDVEEPATTEASDGNNADEQVVADETAEPNVDEIQSAPKTEQQASETALDESELQVSNNIPIEQPQVEQKNSQAGSTNSNNNNYSGLNLNMTASEMRELLARRKKFDPKKAQMNIRQKYEIIQQM